MNENYYNCEECNAYSCFDLDRARTEGYNYGLLTVETNVNKYIEHLSSFEHISNLQGYQYQQGYIAALQHVSRYIRDNGRTLRDGENEQYFD